MNIKIHFVITPEDEAVEQTVKQELHDFEPALNFSPSRPQPSLHNCLEFFATADLDHQQIERLYNWLDNDWDGSPDDASCYGFNTRPFNPHIYYMQMETA